MRSQVDGAMSKVKGMAGALSREARLAAREARALARRNLAKIKRPARLPKKANLQSLLEKHNIPQTLTKAQREACDAVGLEMRWAPKILKKMVHGEERNIAIHPGKQSKHILGQNNYENALLQGKTPSIFYGTIEDAQRLVDEFAGTGEILPQNHNIERVNFGRVVGKYVDETTKESCETTWGTIRYAKDGVHIVPSNPNSHY